MSLAQTKCFIEIGEQFLRPSEWPFDSIPQRRLPSIRCGLRQRKDAHLLRIDTESKLSELPLKRCEPSLSFVDGTASNFVVVHPSKCTVCCEPETVVHLRQHDLR